MIVQRVVYLSCMRLTLDWLLVSHSHPELPPGVITESKARSNPWILLGVAQIPHTTNDNPKQNNIQIQCSWYKNIYNIFKKHKHRLLNFIWSYKTTKPILGCKMGDFSFTNFNLYNKTIVNKICDATRQTLRRMEWNWELSYKALSIWSCNLQRV